MTHGSSNHIGLSLPHPPAQGQAPLEWPCERLDVSAMAMTRGPRKRGHGQRGLHVTHALPCQ